MAVKLSVAIPYRRRLTNLRLAFEALARQTMETADYEVLVGAMEYCADYVELCREYEGRLTIVSVLSPERFEIPRARNLATRMASGQVVVHMDADTLLPADALDHLWDRHFSFGQNACVVGQVVGYDNNAGGDIDTVETLPYAAYLPMLEEIRGSRGASRDPRFQAEHVIPWAFAWTGLVALPVATVRAHGLFFDEDFRGWGVDDLEWGYRVCLSRTPIVLREDVFALHLPHVRDSAANQRSEAGNYRRFLRKWPRPDVELAHAFGDVAANSLFLDHTRQVRRLAGGGDRTLASVRATVDGTDLLLLGVPVDADGQVQDPAARALLDRGTGVEVLPLVGLALPYEDGSVGECRLSPVLTGLSHPMPAAIRTEAHRVARAVTGWSAP
ncbi:MAG TPA: glycosyltransferase [Jiangellales bacterium]|nr:glycosyltransferase [Jiangellales bacterium]